MASSHAADTHVHATPVVCCSWRRLVWCFLCCNLEGNIQHWARRYELLSAGLILSNVLADILDSVNDFPFSEDRSPAFRALEGFTCVVFTVEYSLRLWSCTESETFSGGPIVGRLAFATSLLAAIDVVVLVVFYMDILMTSDKARGFQALRMMRLLALLKMERQTRSFATIFSVLAKKRYELYATLFMAAVLLVMASTAMYYIENAAQPHVFASIPQTMWWSVTAMTTVGYGDILPVTVPGKVLGSCVAFLGVGLFALPSGIISSGFVEVLEEERQAESEEIADMLDEDQACLEQLHGDVASLRAAVEALQSGLEQEQDANRAILRDQRQILLRIRQPSPETVPRILPPAQHGCMPCQRPAG